MEIKFEATKEEFFELAKMAYVAQFVFDSSGEFSEDYKYPHIKTFLSTLNLVNETLWRNLPECDLLELDASNKELFTHTIAMEGETEGVLKEFMDCNYLDKICSEITERDYEENHKGFKNFKSLTGEEIHKRIKERDKLYDINMLELKKNGLKNYYLKE